MFDLGIYRFRLDIAMMADTGLISAFNVIVKTFWPVGLSYAPTLAVSQSLTSTSLPPFHCQLLSLLK